MVSPRYLAAGGIAPSHDSPRSKASCPVAIFKKKSACIIGITHVSIGVGVVSMIRYAAICSAIEDLVGLTGRIACLVARATYTFGPFPFHLSDDAS